MKRNYIADTFRGHTILSLLKKIIAQAEAHKFVYMWLTRNTHSQQTKEIKRNFSFIFIITVMIDHRDATVTDQKGKAPNKPDSATGTTDLTVRHAVVTRNVKREKIGHQLR